jgi:signal transduction histidine kinase
MLSFEILKPYWQTWWFYLLCILSLIGITFLIIRYREQQLKNVLSMRNKIANDLHDDVGSALSTINLYSEVAKNKSGANKDLEPILDKITGISTEMQENMTHIVWSLQPRNDNFDQMLLRIKSYALENLSVKNIEIYFDIDEKLSGIKIAANKRKELFLIYKEVLNNIQKYANATQVHIQFKRLGGDLRMEIRDNGIGFDIKALNDGNGMFTMRERAAALNGNFDMDSEPGKGTTVVLTFKY